MPGRFASVASLDGAPGRGYKRAMFCPFGIARRITGPAR
jgi:hypothetical protein